MVEKGCHCGRKWVGEREERKAEKGGVGGIERARLLGGSTHPFPVCSKLKVLSLATARVLNTRQRGRS